MEPTYIPRDIAEYEEHVFLGLTSRQLLWGAIAIATGLSFYMLTVYVLDLPQDLGIYGTIAIAFFLFLMGWGKWQEVRPYSDKLKAYIAFYQTKQKVIYSNESYYFKKGDSNVQKKTRKDKKINKQYIHECRK